MKIIIPKKIKSILIFVLVIGLVIHIYQNYISRTYQYSVQSPDNKYTLEVYYKNSFIAMPGQGGTGSRGTYFKLLNDYGFEIGHSCRNCSPLVNDIEIEWDFDNNWVWIARGRAIDLKTGNCCD